MEYNLKITTEEEKAIMDIFSIIEDGKGVNGSQIIKIILLALSKWYITKEGQVDVPGCGKLISAKDSFIYALQPGRDATLYDPICNVDAIIKHLVAKNIIEIFFEKIGEHSRRMFRMSK